MNRVAIVVEGPSDLVFWKRVFYNYFHADQFVFDVRSLNGATNLIREAPTLTDIFRSAKYHAVIFMLDADKAECAQQVLDLFDNAFKNQLLSEPRESRFAHVCIAFREVESWILADECCMRELVFPNYQFGGDQDRIAGKAKLLRLCKDHGCAFTGMEDREFAKQAAEFFSPAEARLRSPSFDHSWTRVCQCLSLT